MLQHKRNEKLDVVKLRHKEGIAEEKDANTCKAQACCFGVNGFSGAA